MSTGNHYLKKIFSGIMNFFWIQLIQSLYNRKKNWTPDPDKIRYKNMSHIQDILVQTAITLKSWSKNLCQTRPHFLINLDSFHSFTK